MHLIFRFAGNWWISNKPNQGYCINNTALKKDFRYSNIVAVRKNQFDVLKSKFGSQKYQPTILKVLHFKND